uniref:Uncharacterized protein n=1 Tax=Romanomermis culicivorax TaxID=13658 RepID=A0A915I2S8_ROMCU
MLKALMESKTRRLLDPNLKSNFMLTSNKTLPSKFLLNLHKNISGVSTFFLIFVGSSLLVKIT